VHRDPDHQPGRVDDRQHPLDAVGEPGWRGFVGPELHDLDAVVVELGTNESTPAGFPDRIQRMLSIVHPAGLVVWVTVHREDISFAPELNSDIDAAVSALPNGAMADWASVVTPEDLASDGVHPNDQGKRLMASLLADLLMRWRDAATGSGASACAAALGS